MTTNYTSNKLICIAGLAGAGKSTVSSIFKDCGFEYIRFGQIVIDEVKKRGLIINEKNERKVREELRRKHGMAAMAKLNKGKIKKLLKTKNVVADGLYSFDEYKILKREFPNQLLVIAVYAPPNLRYKRIKKRLERGLTQEEAISRDYAEIEKLDKGGPIAMADWTIVNTGTKKDLFNQTHEAIKKLNIKK